MVLYDFSREHKACILFLESGFQSHLTLFSDRILVLDYDIYLEKLSLNAILHDIIVCYDNHTKCTAFSTICQYDLTLWY